MKKSFLFLHFCILVFLRTNAQTVGSPFTDLRDNQIYKTVLMPDGKRWMAENLRYRKGFDNPVFGYKPVTGNIASPGTNLQKTYYCPGPGPFPNSPNTTTTSQADPLLCEYEGALYPFWTAYGQNNGTSNVYPVAGKQGICPDGWHLPSDGEWMALATALSNNFSSLQVLNAGRRDNTGVYAEHTTKAYFWTSSGNGTAAVSHSFSAGTIIQNTSQPASDALSVRCVEGVCKDSFPIVFAAIPTSCENIPVWNEIGILTGTKTRTYNLSVPASTGNWTYAVSVKSYTTSSVPTVSISGNGTAFASVTFTITNPIVDKTFTILITATNQIYCGQLSETHTFTLKDVPVLTTIVGNEGLGDIKTMTDVRDCKVYAIIKMADGKWWMRENLNYQKGLSFNGDSRYRSGNMIAYSSQDGYNGVLGIGNFWCPGLHGATSSSASDCDIWGALYTWPTVVSTDGVGTWSEPSASQLYTQSAFGNPTSACNRGICPPGWHIPSDGEWGDMLNAVETGSKNHNTVAEKTFAGTNAGSTLKSSTFTTGVKQSSGFSILAAGDRRCDGSSFYSRGSIAFFWSSSCYSTMNAWNRLFSSSTVGRYIDNRAMGRSVRCIQD